jgi:hypothetical protein
MSGDENQTVREDLLAAMEKHETPVEIEVKEVVDEPEVIEVEEPKAKRDEKGKFAKKETEPEPQSAAEDNPDAVDDDLEADEPETPVEDKKAPQALSASIKGKWSEIPEEIKNEFIRLEKASSKGVASLKEDAHVGRSLMREIEPYKALIASAGGTPETAVRNLFQTAAILRTGTAHQKQNAVLGIMQEYGINLNGQAPAQVDPYMQKIQSLEQQLQQQQQTRQQQEESQVLSTIDSFLNEADDKGNPKYPLDDSLEAEFVDEIAAVRRRNASYTDRQVLETAYERMSWKVPEIRQTLIERSNSTLEAKRKEKSAQEVAKKQSAAVSIKGTSATSAPQTDIPLRQLLEQQILGTGKRI